MIFRQSILSPQRWSPNQSRRRRPVVQQSAVSAPGLFEPCSKAHFLQNPWRTVFAYFILPWLSLSACSVLAGEPGTASWPSFRGPQASGLADNDSLPTHWSVQRGENIKWKIAIPGLGHSCPVIWGDRIFVTTAVKESGEADLKIGLYGDIASVNEMETHHWRLFCLDKATGKMLWEKTARKAVPRIRRHPKSSHANSTPATDGKRVVCFFGSEGLACFDLDGNVLWQKDLGSLNAGYFRAPSAEWGFGSSPIIHGSRVFVQCDVQTNSFVAAFHLEDGTEIWRTARKDVPTWSTPTLWSRDGQAQLLINGYLHSGGYDPETGKEIWKLTGGGDIPVPTPIVAHDLIFLTSAHGNLSPIYAIRGEAKGEITLAGDASTNAFIAWSIKRGGNYMQTPIVVGDLLYCCNDAGVLSCFQARTGQVHYRERLGGGRSGFTASPVATKNHAYFTSEEGTVYVVKASPKFEILSTNDLGEACLATPAISQGRLFFRTRHRLIAVAETTADSGDRLDRRK